ncbi:MAG: precorrin-2 C(20)-methyltransferase [Eubacteriaceae bacterium]|nr:precorrin-2 C(20)-methyltransferase [Eubacteriaceae bacterium]
MKGKLYGIGTGPGDPELLTIKAVKTIQKCGVVATPKSNSEGGAAFGIVEEYLEGKKRIECFFSMDRDINKRKEARLKAAGEIIGILDTGEDVGFVTLGDPTTYSTYMYVHMIVANAGYETEIIPGVTSFSAAAAAFGIALCEDQQILSIIPGRHTVDIGQALEFPGNKVLMKSGANLDNVLEMLKERGLSANTKIASRVAMDGQRLYESIEEYEASPQKEYFTLAIVKENA